MFKKAWLAILADSGDLGDFSIHRDVRNKSGVAVFLLASLAGGLHEGEGGHWRKPYPLAGGEAIAH